MSLFIERTGKRYGKLVVESCAGIGDHHEFTWNAVCDCGGKIVAQGSALSNGRTKSCGCLKCPHGQSRTTEYRTWRQMKVRCLNHKNKYYNSYGGRGISICDEWVDSFTSFFSCVGKKPSAQHSIDRINNDGNYEPGNVKWSTRMEQQHNTQRVRKLTYLGETLCIREWSRKIGRSANTITKRLNRGWPIENVLSPRDFHSSTMQACRESVSNKG